MTWHPRGDLEVEEGTAAATVRREVAAEEEVSLRGAARIALSNAVCERSCAC